MLQLLQNFAAKTVLGLKKKDISKALKSLGWLHLNHKFEALLHIYYRGSQSAHRSIAEPQGTIMIWT